MACSWFHVKGLEKLDSNAAPAFFDNSSEKIATKANCPCPLIWPQLLANIRVFLDECEIFLLFFFLFVFDAFVWLACTCVHKIVTRENLVKTRTAFPKLTCRGTYLLCTWTGNRVDTISLTTRRNVQMKMNLSILALNS